MAAVAGAVAAAVDDAGDGSDDEMSDSAPFAWRADEHGSDVEYEAEEDSDWVQPPPSADGSFAQKSVDDRVRALWIKWMGDHKIKNIATDPDTIYSLE